MSKKRQVWPCNFLLL